MFRIGNKWSIIASALEIARFVHRSVIVEKFIVILGLYYFFIVFLIIIF